VKFGEVTSFGWSVALFECYLHWCTNYDKQNVHFFNCE